MIYLIIVTLNNLYKVSINTKIMCSRLIRSFRELTRALIQKGKKAEQIKAGKKWDSIVEELRKRK